MREPDRFPAVALGAAGALALVLALTFHLPQRLLAAGAGRPSAHRLDGRIDAGEYRFRWTDEASKIAFHWSIVGDRLIGAVSTPDTGWVAVGFGGEGPLMYGADIVIGTVDARGVAHVEDDFANTPTSHVADTSLGGHDDVLGSAALKTRAGLTMEFERPLTAHDSTDRPIVHGPMRVLVASSETPDLMAYHAEGHKAAAMLDLFAGPPAAAAAPLLPDHLTDVQIMVATWMAVLLIVGVHGLLSRVAEGREPRESPVEAGGASLTVLVQLTVLQLAALATFAVGVVAAWPVWLLGSALAIGLLALAAVVALYARWFMAWRSVRSERDDGVPW